MNFDPLSMLVGFLAGGLLFDQLWRWSSYWVLKELIYNQRRLLNILKNSDVCTEGEIEDWTDDG